MGSRVVEHLNWNLLILIGVTLGQILLAVDNWVHRRERKEAALEYQQSGRASLQAQIDAIVSDSAQYRRTLVEGLSQHREQQEKLRLERASTLASEMAGIHGSLDRLHRKTTENAVAHQEMAGRVLTVELRLEEVFRMLDRRTENRPRTHGERRHE